jgi:hypothetical protein
VSAWANIGHIDAEQMAILIKCRRSGLSAEPSGSSRNFRFDLLKAFVKAF